MENASKALIMAAGVLIGLMIVSLAVYLFVSFGSSSAQMHKQKEKEQLNQFNSQFTSYEGKEDITIYDVITVANLATENNKYYEFNTKTLPNNNKISDNYIWVILNNGVNNIISSGKDKNIDSKTYIENAIGNINQYKYDLQRYTCKVDISSITGRVYKVTFKLK